MSLRPMVRMTLLSMKLGRRKKKFVLILSHFKLQKLRLHCMINAKLEKAFHLLAEDIFGGSDGVVPKTVLGDWQMRSPFYRVSLIYVSVILPMPCCIGYCSFRLNLEIWRYVSSFSILLTILDLYLSMYDF